MPEARPLMEIAPQLEALLREFMVAIGEASETYPQPPAPPGYDPEDWRRAEVLAEFLIGELELRTDPPADG